MRIGLQTWGSEGDIRPFVALAGGLAAAGHEVTLVATEIGRRDYSADALRGGFELRMVASPVFPDHGTLMELGEAMHRARTPMSQSRLILTKAFEPVVEPMFEAAHALCKISDLVVGHHFLHPLRAAADGAGVPSVSVQLMPAFIPTRERPPFGSPPLGPLLTPLGWKLASWAGNWMLLPGINRLRDRIGVPRHRDVMTQTWVADHLNLIAVSPALCGRPSDWDARHVVPGFLVDRTAPTGIDPALEEFLAGGPPPVFFGFGSLMPDVPEAVEATLKLWEEGARLAGVRAIFQVPSDVPHGADTDIFRAGRCSHASVFPRCAAVVHHGGAGTTHSVARAGVPSVVVAHLADQYFWGDTLRKAGVAGRWIDRRKLTARALAHAIREVLDSEIMQTSAQELAGRMRGEDGVGMAVQAIEAVAKPKKDDGSG